MSVRRRAHGEVGKGGVILWKERFESGVDGRDIIGEAVGGLYQLIDLDKARFQRRLCGIGKLRQLFRLIGDHRRFIRQLLDLIVDHFKRARGRQKILGIVRRIVNDPAQDKGVGWGRLRDARRDRQRKR